jgi:hypothetical protein
MGPASSSKSFAFAKAIHAGGAGEAVWLVAANDVAAATARRLAPSPR